MTTDNSLAALYVRINLEERTWQRAVTRAIVYAPALPPEVQGYLRDRDGAITAVTVAVPSRHQSERTYLVLVGTNDQVRCECDAGLDGRPCWHAAAAWLWVYRFINPVKVRIALGQYADPERIARERARLEAVLAGVLA